MRPSIPPLILPSRSARHLSAVSQLALLCAHRFISPSTVTNNLFRPVNWLQTQSMTTARNAPGWDPASKPFPVAERVDHVDTYKSKARGEVKVADPYRWLETPPNQSQETKQWVHAQAELASSYIKGYPYREEFKKRLEATFSYSRYTCPSLKYDGNYYYSFNSGLEPQSRIFKATKSQIASVETDVKNAEQAPGPAGTVFFDANRLSKDGTIAPTVLAFSHSGKRLCYGISKAGSDWFSLYFRETSQPFNPPPQSADIPDAAKGGADRLPDELHHVKFSGATWTHDDQGVFYQRYPVPEETSDLGTELDPNVDAKLYYHKLATQQSEDILVCDVDPENRTGMWGSEVSDDGKYLLVRNGRDTAPKSRLYVMPLDENGSIPRQMKWLCLADKFEDDLDYLTNDGNTFYFMTNRDAPRYRIVKVTLDPSGAQETREIWKLNVNASVSLSELVPEDEEGAVLSSATVVDHNKLLLVYSRNVMDELWQFDLGSGERVGRLLPDLIGTIGQISGKREDDTAYVSSVSFVSPGTITRLTWRGTAASQKPETAVHRRIQVPGIDADDYVSEQKWFESADGTRVPMFVTYHKSTKLDGTSPAWLYSYGGFSIPLNPGFSPSMMTFVKLYGGVLVWVNARGGSEFGEDWHLAGSGFNKRHTFEDVLAGAKYLHENKVAAKGKIILNGGSNGGLTVLASTNMATEEHGIGAAVAEVGVLDLLRFVQFTIGRAWVADYLDPDDPAAFDHLLSISPLHNVQDKIYPATILLTSDHDDRVSAAHSFKMTAELQHRLKDNPNPILLRLDLDSGHGAGKSTQQRIEEAADKYAAVARALDLQVKL